MRSPGRTLSWLGLLAVLAAAAVFGVRRTSDSARARVLPLDDGDRIRLLGTTHGTNHAWVAGRFPALDPLRRLWRPIKALLGPPTERVAHPSPVDALGVYYLHEKPSGGSVNDPYWIVATVDEHGCRLAADSSRSQFSVGGFQGVVAQNLECYPRRATRFGIELARDTSGSTSNRVRLDVPNGRPWRGAEWTPEPLPATREIDGLRFTLLGLFGWDPWPYPRFRVEQDGVERPEWETAELWFHDATGNRAQSPSLCRHEPAWRIEARFRRKPEGLTDATAVWDLGTWDVPEDGQVLEFDSERILQGVRLRPLVLGGQGVFEFHSQGGWHLTGASNLPPTVRVPRGGGVSTRGGPTGTTAEVRRSEPWIALELGGLQPDQRWTVVAVDENGNARRNSGWSGVGGAFYVSNLEVPSGSRRVGVRLVVDRVRTAEFLVAPPAPGG